MIQFSKLTIIIPTFNEKENIRELLNKLLSLYPGVKIIVADDESNDGTQHEVTACSTAEGNVRLFERKDAKIRGITASVVDALKLVQTEYFCVMDGDLQHPPEVVSELYSKLGKDIDLVVACRIPYRENQGLHRIIMTKAATLAACWFLKFRSISVRDPMSGFFAGKTPLAQMLAENAPSRFEMKGYKVLFDILKMLPPGVKIAQTDYQFAFRPGGHSKLRPAHALYFFRSLFR